METTQSAGLGIGGSSGGQGHVPTTTSLTPDQLIQLSNQMEQDYTRRLAEGPAVKRLGPGTSQNGFNTELTQGAEKVFERWPVATGDSGSDYDYRGAFAEGLSRDNLGHLPDTYKKP